MQYNYMFASSGHKVDVIVDSMTRKTLNKGDKLAKKVRAEPWIVLPPARLVPWLPRTGPLDCSSEDAGMHGGARRDVTRGPTGLALTVARAVG